MGLVTTHTEGRVVTHSDDAERPVEMVQLPQRDEAAGLVAPAAPPKPVTSAPAPAAPAKTAKPTPAVKAATKQKAARVKKATKAR